MVKSLKLMFWGAHGGNGVDLEAREFCCKFAQYT